MSDDSGTIQLLAEARSGDRVGMGRLAVLVWERLYPFVFRTTLDHDATEDILQETLLTMLRRLGSLRDERRFWPWMYHIALSRLHDRLRDRRLRTLHEAKLARCGAAAPGGDSPVGAGFKPALIAEDGWTTQGPDLDPLEIQVREETLRELSLAVAQLDQRQRDIVQLRGYEQRPYTEIAAMMQTTPQRVRTHFHRAKKSLRKRLVCSV